MSEFSRRQFFRHGGLGLAALGLGGLVLRAGAEPTGTFDIVLAADAQAPDSNSVNDSLSQTFVRGEDR